MPRPREDLEKVNLRLIRGDVATLQKFYPNVNYNRVIRTIIHKHIRMLNERASQALSEGELEE